jgi:hypothetical protein
MGVWVADCLEANRVAQVVHTGGRLALLSPPCKQRLSWMPSYAGGTTLFCGAVLQSLKD